MYGRYGTDQLYRTLIWAYFAIMMLGLILGRAIDIKIYTIISILGFALIAFAFFRVFSKNIEKRRKENGFLLQQKSKSISESEKTDGNSEKRIFSESVQNAGQYYGLKESKEATAFPARTAIKALRLKCFFK